MKIALILSILVKGLGAILEIASQVIITRFGGVELFGEYSFYVSVVELLCWLLFAGIVKTNAYYIANGVDTSGFRFKLFALFGLPVVIVLAAFGWFYSLLMSAAILMSILFGCQMNLSSMFLACRRFKVSLFGEYLISRVVIVLGLMIMVITGTMNVTNLVLLFGAGFLASILFFLVMKRSLELPERTLPEHAEDDMLRKHIRFQLTDFANGLIGQVPVIVQFLFTGAFQAGVLSVVLVTRKVINFIAGPTAKVYLPEFAKKHGEGDLTGLREVYREIVLMQMCFILPMGLILIGASEPILSLYNSRLVDYAGYLQFAAVVFMIMALFGPQGNLIAMVGKEGVEAKAKWASFFSMVVVMAITFHSDLFVVFGIAAQVIVDTTIKLRCLIEELHGFPLRKTDWIKMFVPFFLCLGLSLLVNGGYLFEFATVCLIAFALFFFQLFAFFGNQIMDRLKSIS